VKPESTQIGLPPSSLHPSALWPFFRFSSVKSVESVILLFGFCFLPVLTGGCSQSKTYRGPEFEISRPDGYDWTLASRREQFTVAPPMAYEGLPDVSKAKLVELTCPGRRATIEVYLVNSGTAPAEKFAEAILRKPQRRNLAEGEPKATTVGGRPGQASLAVWQQTRDAPKVLFYCVRVPVGGRLWFFVASMEEGQFESLRPDLDAILRTVKFR